MNKISGTTLIEVIISMFLLSILLLGIDAMHVISLRQSRINYYYATAQQQISNRIERSYTSDSNLSTWNQQNQEVLPNGRGTINKNKLSIFWGEENALDCESNTIKSSGCLHLKLS